MQQNFRVVIFTEGHEGAILGRHQGREARAPAWDLSRSLNKEIMDALALTFGMPEVTPTSVDYGEDEPYRPSSV